MICSHKSKVNTLAKKIGRQGSNPQAGKAFDCPLGPILQLRFHRFQITNRLEKRGNDAVKEEPIKMKRLHKNIVIGIVALSLPVAAWAADSRWTRIASVKTGDNLITLYLRLGAPKTGPQSETHTRVWELYSNSAYQKTSSTAYKSEINLQDYDCASAKVATLSQTLYDGEMGTGKVLSSRSVQGYPNYSYPVNGTLEYVAMQAACAAAGRRF